jgi:cobalamin synthase
MPPSASDLVVGCAAVVLACLGAAYAVRAALQERNWLWLVSAVGCAAAVVGVVGQRSFPSEDTVTRLGKDAAGRQVPGPWDAGVGIPVLGMHLTPVTVAGLLLAVAGLSLVLFFEPAADARHEPRRPLRPLGEDDTV